MDVSLELVLYQDVPVILDIEEHTCTKFINNEL